MKSTSPLKPIFVIKITKEGGTVLRRLSRFNKRFLNYYLRNYKEGERASLKVIYKPGIENRGVYFNKKDFLHAWYCFTEPDLIRDAILNY
jgi:hypothetical protein